MVKYHNQAYLDNISLRIEEIAAHFDVKKLVLFDKAESLIKGCYCNLCGFDFDKVYN